METKEQLQKKLAALAEQEKKKMIAEHYPIFKKKYEGKFFKLQNNYSCPAKKSDYWWCYVKVVEIKPSEIYDTSGNGVTSTFSGWSFQTDKYGDVSIQKEKRSYVHGLGKEITEKEFNEAWNKMADSLEQLP